MRYRYIMLLPFLIVGCLITCYYVRRPMFNVLTFPIWRVQGLILDRENNAIFIDDSLDTFILIQSRDNKPPHFSFAFNYSAATIRVAGVDSVIQRTRHSILVVKADGSSFVEPVSA